MSRNASHRIGSPHAVGMVVGRVTDSAQPLRSRPPHPDCQSSIIPRVNVGTTSLLASPSTQRVAFAARPPSGRARADQCVLYPRSRLSKTDTHAPCCCQPACAGRRMLRVTSLTPATADPRPQRNPFRPRCRHANRTADAPSPPPPSAPRQALRLALVKVVSARCPRDGANGFLDPGHLSSHGNLAAWIGTLASLHPVPQCLSLPTPERRKLGPDDATSVTPSGSQTLPTRLLQQHTARGHLRKRSGPAPCAATICPREHTVGGSTHARSPIGLAPHRLSPGTLCHRRASKIIESDDPLPSRRPREGLGRTSRKATPSTDPGAFHQSWFPARLRSRTPRRQSSLPAKAPLLPASTNGL